MARFNVNENKIKSLLSCKICKNDVEKHWVFCVKCGNNVVQQSNITNPSVDIYTTNFNKETPQSKFKTKNKNNFKLQLPNSLHKSMEKIMLSIEVEKNKKMNESHANYLKANMLEFHNTNLIEISTIKSIQSRNIESATINTKLKSGYLDDNDSVASLYVEYRKQTESESFPPSCNINCHTSSLAKNTNASEEISESWFWGNKTQLPNYDSPEEDLTTGAAGGSYFWGNILPKVSVDDASDDEPAKLSSLLQHLSSESSRVKQGPSSPSINKNPSAHVIPRTAGTSASALASGISVLSDDSDSSVAVHDTKGCDDDSNIANTYLHNHSIYADENTVSADLRSASSRYGLIFKLYQAAQKRMLELIEESNAISFRTDLLEIKHSLSSLSHLATRISNTLEWAASSDAQARHEYSVFLEVCGRIRSENALELAQLLSDVTEKQQEHAGRHRRAAELAIRYKGQRGSQQAQEAVAAAAAEEVLRQATRLQAAQEAEAETLQSLLSQEHAARATVQKWQPRHSAAQQLLQAALLRTLSLLHTAAARRIQRTARLKLLVYFRRGTSFRRNRRGSVVPSSVRVPPCRRRRLDDLFES